MHDSGERIESILRVIQTNLAHIDPCVTCDFSWTADTALAVAGVLEVLFGALVICPHYTRLSAFFLSQLTNQSCSTRHVAAKQ